MLLSVKPRDNKQEGFNKQAQNKLKKIILKLKRDGKK